MQILLVDLLHAADIQLTAFVSHSSSEIAAAYSASMIDAEDAMRIAYYGGLYIEEHFNIEGAIMVVGTTFDNVTKLCSLDVFSGRLPLASPIQYHTTRYRRSGLEAKKIIDIRRGLLNFSR